MEKEIWRDINGYEGLYQISNLGNVKSLNYRSTGKEGILKLQKDRNGYSYVCLWKNGKTKHFQVHRLVAQTFIPNPNNLPQVNHKDENKQNNCVWNLEYCDHKYNCNYGTRNERMSKALTNYSKLSKQVIQIDKKTNEVIAEFPSTKEVQRQFGFAHTNISRCCKDNAKSAYGYKWRYK